MIIFVKLPPGQAGRYPIPKEKELKIKPQRPEEHNEELIA